jgi:hypothetical protein
VTPTTPVIVISSWNDIWLNRDAISNSNVLHFGPSFDHHPGKLVTEDQGKNSLRKRVRLLRYLDRTVQIFVQIGSADSAIGVPYHHLVRTAGLWNLHLVDS